MRLEFPFRLCSEENSEEFVDATDQRDWTVAVEAFMQARFRTSSMTDDDVHRNLSLLRRRYSMDDSGTTLTPSGIVILGQVSYIVACSLDVAFSSYPYQT